MAGGRYVTLISPKTSCFSRLGHAEVTVVCDNWVKEKKQPINIKEKNHEPPTNRFSKWKRTLQQNA